MYIEYVGKELKKRGGREGTVGGGLRSRLQSSKKTREHVPGVVKNGETSVSLPGISEESGAPGKRNAC